MNGRQKEGWEAMYVKFAEIENGVLEERNYPAFTVVLTAIDLDQEAFWKSFSESVQARGKAEAIDSLSKLVEKSGASIMLLTSGGRRVLNDHELFSVIDGVERTELWKLRNTEVIENAESLRRIRS